MSKIKRIIIEYEDDEGPAEVPFLPQPLQIPYWTPYPYVPTPSDPLKPIEITWTKTNTNDAP